MILRCFLPIISVVSLSWASAAIREEVPSIPTLIFDVHHSPLWVSASAAVDENGRLSPMVHAAPYLPGSQGEVSKNKAMNTVRVDDSDAGCKGFRVAYDGERIRTVNEVINSAVAGYSGIVIATAPGFLQGAPGSLVRIKIDRTIIPSEAFDTKHDLYLFIEHARFWAGDEKFCSGFSPNPVAVGKRLVLFPGAPALDPDHRLMTQLATPYFVLNDSGHVEFTSAYHVRQDVRLKGIDTIEKLERAARVKDAHVQ